MHFWCWVGSHDDREKEREFWVHLHLQDLDDHGVCLAYSCIVRISHKSCIPKI